MKILFTSPLSGGGVLSLPNRWYLAPKIVYALFKFGLILIKRFLTIFIKGLAFKLFKFNKDN